MSFDVRRLATTQGRIAPVNARFAPAFCFVLLTASCILASFTFACATPFAAFAVVAAAMLPLPSALLVVGAAWIVNQAIGFGALGYPHDTNTLLWGLAIGLAALTATVCAKAILRAWPRIVAIALAAAVLAAYASYEVVLLAFTPALGGAGAFTATIVIRLGLLNLFWLIGLIAVCAVFRRAAMLWWRQPEFRA